MDTNKIKKFFEINKIINDILLYSLAFTMVYLFLRLSFNGGVGVVSINYYGEMVLETVFIFIFLITTIIRQIGERLKWTIKMN